MDTSTSGYGNQAAVAPEFGTWPVEGAAVEKANEIRTAFNTLLGVVEKSIPAGNARYLALVKTKLEEGCFFAIKGIAKA